jgi:DNA ligase (NAD+)
VGKKVATSVVDYFSSPENLKEIHRLLSLGVKPRKIKTRKGHPFFAKTFVLTGSLKGYSRSGAIALIKQRGGKMGGSVSKKTDFLLAGSDPGSKWEKAKSLGVVTLTEKEFEQLL